MNSFNRFSSLSLFVLFTLLLWGCLEYSITTTVMPDGRLLRTIIVKGDSTDIFTGSFPVPSDSSWIISTRLEPRNEKDITEGKVFIYEARKEFKTFRDLNAEFNKDSVTADHIAIRVSLEKKFRWFFTRFQYAETFGRLFPFHSVPVSEYLSEAELQIRQADMKDIAYSREEDRIYVAEDTAYMPALSGNDSIRMNGLRDTIEQKFETWQKVNIYKEFYHVVTAALKKLGSNADTVAARESFYWWLDQHKTFESGIEDDNAFVNAASTYFHVGSAELQAANPQGFESFKKKFRVAAYSLETYTSSVIMPGTITKTNAEKTSNNSASWTFKIENFYAADFTMHVESRIVNIWPIAGTFIILIAAIALLLKRSLRK